MWSLWYSSAPVLHFPWGTVSCHAVLRHCHCLRRLAVLAMTTLSLPWQLQLSLGHPQDFVALYYSAVCSKCFHVPQLMCGDGILWEPGSRAALPQHINCGPQATFWVTNPFLSRVGCWGVWMPVVMVEGGVLRSLCQWWDWVSLKFLGIYLPFRVISFIHPLYYRKVTPRKPSLVITESFVSVHPHLPDTSGCMDWLLCFTVFPHLLPEAKVLPTQSAAQYKQLLCLVLVGPSLGYVHKKIFLFW